ncbi:MAG: hypothetical protein NWE94_01905 [Candidatus Bathyarchaeota archaeon]|nr:hypothetical protein [Candidatus Bathyarchaeota archaeon]
MKKETNATEPYYYIALVVKGTEKQYLNLLKYLKNRNKSQVIYQCKSLTYLRIARDNGVKIQAAHIGQQLETETQGGAAP